MSDDKKVDLSDGKWHPVKGHAGIWQRKTKKGEIRWGARAYDPVTKNSRWLGTFDTRKEAKAAKRKAEDEFRPRRRMRIRDYAARWLELHSEGRRLSTLRTYRYGIRRFVERFGDLRFDQLDRIECLEWVKEVGVWSVAPARIMLNDAIDDGLLRTNPLANLRRKHSRGRRDLAVIPTMELQRMIAMAPQVLGPQAGVMMGCLLDVLAHEGLRQSEALALHPEWVSRERGEIEISAQLERVTREEVAPKTGPRTIALTPRALAAFDRLPPRNGSNYLFTTQSGTPFTPSRLVYYWHKLRAAAGHHKMQLHELRHYHATWLAYQGVPEWAIRIQLGHSSGTSEWALAVQIGAQGRALIEPSEPGNGTTRRYLHRDQLALELIREATEEPTVPIPDTHRENRPSSTSHEGTVGRSSEGQRQ